MPQSSARKPWEPDSSGVTMLISSPPGDAPTKDFHEFIERLRNGPHKDRWEVHSAIRDAENHLARRRSYGFQG